MAHALKKIGDFLGLTESREEELTSVAVADGSSRSVRSVPSEAPAWARSTSIAPTPQIRVTPTSEQRELPVMDRIITIHPRFYNEARTIGEHYREGQPVIMNLSDMEDSERKRLVDFASGLVFGHHGSIERVTSKVFLLTPPNLKVSVEAKTAAAEASFFNQS
ncbi:MAG: cell division protein SepF [Actinomycetes bacterium]|jgi:cell division inhibitor SepF